MRGDNHGRGEGNRAKEETEERGGGKSLVVRLALSLIH